MIDLFHIISSGVEYRRIDEKKEKIIQDEFEFI